MRYTPAALALCLVTLVTASASWSAPVQPLDARAAALEKAGREALAAGDADKATDAFEAALTVQPGHPVIVLDLAEAARRQGMQGKALHYYRDVLASDPQNLTALSGEGEALAEKGALEKARRNLAQLQGLCGATCTPSRDLAAAIARGPSPQMVSAAEIKPDVKVN
jgi:Tfp pilus assembly protein PilF